MNLRENPEQLRKNSEQMLWSGCGKCSRRKFYQTGYDDGLKKSDEELRELREYKHKVEKFISKYKSIVLKIPIYSVIDMLKEELGYENR